MKPTEVQGRPATAAKRWTTFAASVAEYTFSVCAGVLLSACASSAPATSLGRSVTIDGALSAVWSAEAKEALPGVDDASLESIKTRFARN